MPPPRLVLLTPQLLWPEPADAAAWGNLALPGLESLLGRAAFARFPTRAWEETLAISFGRDSGAPFGALRLRGEAGSPPSGEGQWLCADPVHLKFHHERVVLADTAAFPLSLEDSQELVAALNREFADIGTFHAAHPRRWYLRLNAAASCDTPPLSAVAGRVLGDQLPEGPESARFKRWLNEIQMFLHHHPVNTARAAAGLPMVNGLWLWGAGRSPEATKAAGAPPEFTDFAPRFAGIWCDDPLARGLALAAGMPAHPTPPNLDKLLALAGPGNHYLVVLDDLLLPALYEDHSAWQAAMTGLEAAWFAPLAFDAPNLPLTLLAPTSYGLLRWERRPADRWKFWRRPQSPAELARRLAS
jgi:hypothetical protein